MKFISFYKNFISEFREEYQHCIDTFSPSALYDPIHYVLGNSGKQLRPAFLTAIALTDRSITPDHVYPAACCIEMIHNFTLVHDDIMDNDLLRHGKQTVHAKWGVNEAILSGDGLFAMALKLLDHYKNEPVLYTKLMSIALEAVIIVCEGQAQDMDFESRDDVELAEYLEMVEKKTAHLLSVSARIGAIIAGTDEKDELLIEQIIRELGIVFQIQDDLLELTSNSDNMGKTLGSDLIKKKKTFPYLYAKEELEDEKWKEFLERTTINNIEAHGVEPARKILENNFIFDRIEEVIKLRNVTIQDLIKKLPNGKRELFYSMVEFVMNRKK